MQFTTGKNSTLLSGSNRYFARVMQSHILRYIPQRPPFVMVDTIIKADQASSQTSFTIRADNIFVNDGVCSAAALVENIAQTAAAGMGYKMHTSGQAAPEGYIGGVRNLNVVRLPLVNEVLHTEVTILYELLSAQKVAGIIKIDGAEIASCELQIFLRPSAD